jgi:hypothetical protein
MHFNFIALIVSLLFALERAAFVVAVDHTSVKIAHVEDESPLHSAIRVDATPHALSEKIPALGPSTTSPNSAFHALAAEYDEILFLCSQEGCEGICFSYNLAQLVGGCYTSSLNYMSAVVLSGSGRGLQYGVYASLDECALPVKFPTVNTCYNVFYDSSPYNFPCFNKS